MVSNPCGSKWPLVSREVDERTLSPSTRNLKRPAINVEELNSRVKRRQRSSLLNTTRAELVLQVRGMRSMKMMLRLLLNEKLERN